MAVCGTLVGDSFAWSTPPGRRVVSLNLRRTELSHTHRQHRALFMLHYSRFFGLKVPQHAVLHVLYSNLCLFFFQVFYFYYCQWAPFSTCANATLCHEPITVRSDAFATAAAAATAECTQLRLALKCVCFHGKSRFMDFLCSYVSMWGYAIGCRERVLLGWHARQRCWLHSAT